MFSPNAYPPEVVFCTSGMIEDLRSAWSAAGYWFKSNRWLFSFKNAPKGGLHHKSDTLWGYKTKLRSLYPFRSAKRVMVIVFELHVFFARLDCHVNPLLSYFPDTARRGNS